MKKILLKYIYPKYLIHLIALKHYFVGENEIRFLKKFVNSKKNLIDIGSYIGVYSYFLNRLSKII